MLTPFKRAALNAAFVCLLYVLTAVFVYFAFTRQQKPIDSFATSRFIILLLFTPILGKYFLHLLISPFYPAVEAYRTRKRSPSFAPLVSVLIPAWNEEVGISATLQSVLGSDYPRLEIVVVNDGSTDNTHDLVKSFVTEYKATFHSARFPIHYINLPNGGKARALNTALRRAKGEIVITIDADSIVDPQAIQNMVKRFSDPRVASVAGNVVIGNRTKPIGLIQQLEYLYGFYFKRADSLMGAVYIVGGAAAAYRKDVITSLGGFNENIITEDIELSTRLQDNGHVVRYVADAIVYTEGPTTFRGLCRQRLRWKYGRLRTFYIYRYLFFSLRSRHNKYLSFIVLPLALFAEALLFFEGILLSFFYFYTFYANDFSPLLLFIGILTAIVCVQIFSDKQMRYHLNLLVLAPGAWILFYIMDFVEYQALIRSAWHLIRKRTPQWQIWVRQGIPSN